jgi:hypothetical protein
METKVHSTLNIAQDALHGGEVRLSWIMHKKTDLLDSICNIRVCKGEILKGASNVAKLRWVRHWNTISRQLVMSINICATRLVVTHTSTVQNIQHILLLREK